MQCFGLLGCARQEGGIERAGLVQETAAVKIDGLRQSLFQIRGKHGILRDIDAWGPSGHGYQLHFGVGRKPYVRPRALNPSIAMNEPSASSAVTSEFVSSFDGLKLHARCFGQRPGAGLPVVCLPGLSRTTADFEDLATALSQDIDHPRRVIAIDARGRGRSEYDRNPKNYTYAIEMADALAVMTALSAAPAVIVGSSRGGLLAMAMGSARPTMIAGVVLNDIGPVIDAKGLMRIKSYIGKLPEPKDMADGAAVLRRLFSVQFPKLAQEEWLAFARRSWREEDGRLVSTYDPKLSATFEGIDLEQPLPPLWNEFNTLANVPLMVIRGANSDLLSAATVEEMRRRRPDIESLEIADQGHTPLLADRGTIARIAAFAVRCDETLRH